jgi:membrane protease YdiL (CAAX protease family)
MMDDPRLSTSSHDEGESQPQGVAWTAWDIVLAVAAGLGIGIVLSALGIVAVEAAGIDLSETVIVSLATTFIYAGVAAGVHLLLFRRRGVCPGDVGLVRVSGGTLGRMVLVALLLQFVVGFVVLLTAPLLGDPPSPGEQLAVEEGVSISAAETALLFLDAAIVAPIVEELVFRGFLYRYFRARWGIATSVVASSLIFAVVHPALPLMPAIFVLGVGLALVAERYSSLYPSMLIHGIHNGIAVMAVVAISS